MNQHLCCKILKGTVHYIVSKFLSKYDVYNYARSTICCTQLSDSHMIYTFNIICCDMVILYEKAHLVEVTGSAEMLRNKGDKYSQRLQVEVQSHLLPQSPPHKQPLLYP